MRVDMPAAKMMPATRPVPSARIYFNLRPQANRASAHDPQPATGENATSPSPVEVKSPQVGVNVNHLAGKIQTGHQKGFKRIGIDVLGAHAPDRHFGVVKGPRGR